MGISASTDPASMKNARGTTNKELSDGPLKFILHSSPLTAVLEQTKENGQTPLFPQSNCTAETEAVNNKKMINPIKGSRLTAVLKEEDSIRYYAKIFAEKMQQSLSNQQKPSHTRVIEEVKDKTMVTPIKESRLTNAIEEKSVVHYYAEMFAEKMQQILSSQPKPATPIRLTAEQIERVILTTKRTKLSSVNIAKISRQANTMTDDTVCSGTRITSSKTASATSQILRKVKIQIV